MAVIYIALRAVFFTLVINIIYYAFRKDALRRHYNIGIMIILFLIIGLLNY